MINKIDPIANHAAWNENFPFTRLPTTPVDETRPQVNTDLLATVGPDRVRQMLDTGGYGGRTQRPDSDTDLVWQSAVQDARAAMERW